MSSDFNSWEKQFNKQADIILKTDVEIIERAAIEFKKRVENRTPVGDPTLWNWPAHKDYKPGTLRASWTMGREGIGITTVITIENDVPYGPRIEYGSWSTQAPKGMMRITALEWADIVNQVSKKYKK